MITTPTEHHHTAAPCTLNGCPGRTDPDEWLCPTHLDVMGRLVDDHRARRVPADAPATDEPVNVAARDYRRAAALWRHHLAAPQNLAGVNAVIAEVDTLLEVSALLGALLEVAVEAAPNLDSDATREHLSAVAARFAVYESQDTQ